MRVARLSLPTSEQASRTTEVLLNSLNLVSKRGHGIRQRALANLAVGILKTSGTEATPSNLEKLWKDFGLGEKSVGGLKACIEAAVGLGYIVSNGDSYTLTSRAKSASVEEAIQSSFHAFERELQLAWRDKYDPHLTASARHAFSPSVKAYLHHVIETTITNGLRGAVSSDLLISEVEKIAASFGVPNYRDYAEILVAWIRAQPPALGEVASALYTMTASLSLFSAHNEMADATREALQGSWLCLDANFLVQLLCPKTSSWHKACLEIITMCKELRVSLFTLDSYVAEVRHLAQATQRTYSAAQESGDWLTKDNQLIHEIRARTGGRIPDVVKEIEKIEAVLAEHGIETRALDLVKYKGEESIVDAIHSLLNATGSYREPGAVDRDAAAVAYVASLQQEAGGPIPNPWLLTFDNKLVGGEHLVRQAAGGRAVTIHAATWLIGVGGMVEVAEDGVNVAGVAAAWLSLGFTPLERITADEVIEVLSYQIDIPEEARAEFVQNCLRSHLLHEVDRRLRRRAYSELPPLIDELVKDAVVQMGRSLASRIQESVRLRESIKRLAQDRNVLLDEARKS